MRALELIAPSLVHRRGPRGTLSAQSEIFYFAAGSDCPPIIAAGGSKRAAELAALGKLKNGCGGRYGTLQKSFSGEVRIPVLVSMLRGSKVGGTT